jgi:hypothetical protein
MSRNIKFVFLSYLTTRFQLNGRIVQNVELKGLPKEGIMVTKQAN